MEHNNNKPSYKPNTLQEYLSLGYVYLIILGLVSDVIYYKFLNINILDYASVLDILISPVSILFSHIIILLACLFAILFMYVVVIYLNPAIHKKYRNRRWYQRLHNIEKIDQMIDKKPDTNRLLMLFAVMVMSLFLGLGMGRGSSTAERLKENRFEFDDQITFSDNFTKNVHILGQNSQYVFYVGKDDSVVSIVPITPHIKAIQHKDN